MRDDINARSHPGASSYADGRFGDIRFPTRDTEVIGDNNPLSPLRCGPGACSKSGCNCQGYEGSASTCANQGCGHSYQDHW